MKWHKSIMATTAMTAFTSAVASLELSNHWRCVQLPQLHPEFRHGMGPRIQTALPHARSMNVM